MQKKILMCSLLFSLALSGCAAKVSMKEDTIVKLKPLQQVTALTAGGSHTCGLLLGGTATCWGSNQTGQLGNEVIKEISIFPVAVIGISNIKAIAAGYFHTCTILSDGKVNCFGVDLTRSDIKNIDPKAMPKLFSRPVEVKGISNAAVVASGWLHSCVILSNGEVECWGDNETGQLGDGTKTTSTTPVKVKGISNAVAITTGIAHTCVVLSNGTVKCWGTDSFGGRARIYGVSSPIPIEIKNLSSATSVAAGRNHTCALLSDGTVKCWGSNILGQLGDARAFISATPLEVNGISNATAISAGSFHTCALLSNGTVKCWGVENYQLLASSPIQAPAFSPVPPVSPIPFTVEGISSAINITSGGTHSCALLADGTVKCWGGNEKGQLGNDSHTTWSSTPMEVIESQTNR